MKMRPKQFYFATWALLLMALSFPVQAAFLYGHQFNELSSIFQKITWINWLVMGSLVLTAWLYFQASRALLYFAPLMLALVAFNNYIVGSYGGDFSMTQTSLASLGVSSIFLPLLLPSSQILLKDPKRRWWRRSKRYNRKLNATLNPFVGEMLHVQTYDISKTGAFLSLEEYKDNNYPKVGDTVRVSFSISSMKKVRCEAIVVRIAEPEGKYPRGMGIRFKMMDKGQEKSFHQFLSNQDLSH